MDELSSRAFDAFFRANVLRSIQHLVRLGFSPECAEEAVEDTMVTLCARWKDIRFPRTWVLRTAEGRALTVARERFDTLPTDAEHHELPLRVYDEDPVLQEESKARIVRLLEGLAPQRRAVFSASLSGYEDLEIAEALRINVRTVRSHRRYARADIAAKLEREGGLT